MSTGHHEDKHVNKGGEGADTATMPVARLSTRRLVVQLIGYGAGLALLGWCVSRALSPENRGQLAKLGEASAGEVALLCMLSGATIVLNGLIFWAAIRPVRRVPLGSVLATNAVAVALNYVPFKLSVLSRVLIHNRRDGVPLLTIGGWLAAVVAVLCATLGPMVAISLKHPRIDATWAGLVAGAMALAAGAIVIGARICLSRHVGGIALRLARLTKIGRKAADSEAGPRLLDGLRMLSSPRAVGTGIALRIADLLVQSARFVIAAGILGVALRFDRAFLLAATYFGIGIVSPFGMLGTREAGAAGIAGALEIPDPGVIAAVVLLVSATEALVTIVLATLATAYLRPMRLLAAGRMDGAGPSPTASGAVGADAPTELPLADASGAGSAQSDRR